ncbi:MAG: hypothetical protein WCD13_00485 [Pseudolabrys sp.]
MSSYLANPRQSPTKQKSLVKKLRREQKNWQTSRQEWQPDRLAQLEVAGMADCPLFLETAGDSRHVEEQANQNEATVQKS